MGDVNVLGYLQFGDAVRQRNEQVADDLRDLASNLFEHTDDSAEHATRERCT